MCCIVVFEEDVEGFGIVVGQQVFCEVVRIDLQGFCPVSAAIGWDSPATVLQLGDEGVVVEVKAVSQVALGKPCGLSK